MEWYLKSSKQGNSDAQRLIGNLYRGGLGVTKDDTKAMELFLESAKKGNIDAQKSIKNLNENGYGATANTEEQRRETADSGNTVATKPPMKAEQIYRKGYMPLLRIFTYSLIFGLFSIFLFYIFVMRDILNALKVIFVV
jgi:TPR repeat protein